MIGDALQETRQLAISDLLGPNELVLRRFRGHEGLSELFSFELELLSADEGIKGGDLLGRNVTVRIESEGGEPRYFNGLIAQFAYHDQAALGTTYRARVVPWLWLLGHTADCRIFQHLSTPEILQRVFTERGFHDFDLTALHSDYDPREYCVQYRESDLAFVCRLMEEEGIFYFFRHENGRHTLVLADSTAVYAPIADREIDMADPDGTGDLNDQVYQWEHGVQFVPGRWTERDYNFQTPRASLTSSERAVRPVQQQELFEVFDYPGRFQERHRADAWTRLRMESVETRQDLARGKATYRSFTPAGTFRVRSHRTAAEVGKSYVLIHVEYEASVGGSYLTGTDTDEANFDCHFTCVPAHVPFRPERQTPRPIVEGPQTAVVVGPSGEEIYTDAVGRVKVHFHWDREGNWDENDSCWLRVSQTHAGRGWGSIDVPRIGEEVVVKFLEGDPDRPLVTGRVYNAEARPPFALPDEKTRSGGKSNTHKGSGYNEISMDDTADSEQLRTNAQFNMDTVVGNHLTTAVGVDRAQDIGNNDDLIIGVDSLLDVGNDHATMVGVDATYEIGNQLVIEAGTAITLQCGAATIHMNQAGIITISGQIVQSAATAAHNIVAPLTQLTGSQMLNQAGLVSLMLGGIAKINGQETAIQAPTIDVRGGLVVVKGTPIQLGQVGAPLATIPTIPGPASSAPPAGPQSPQGGPAAGGQSPLDSTGPVKSFAADGSPSAGAAGAQEDYGAAERGESDADSAYAASETERPLAPDRQERIVDKLKASGKAQDIVEAIENDEVQLFEKTPGSCANEPVACKRDDRVYLPSSGDDGADAAITAHEVTHVLDKSPLKDNADRQRREELAHRKQAEVYKSLKDQGLIGEGLSGEERFRQEMLQQQVRIDDENDRNQTNLAGGLREHLKNQYPTEEQQRQREAEERRQREQKERLERQEQESKEADRRLDEIKERLGR